MRIRYKKWARPELEASEFYVDNPEEWKDNWKNFFKNPENPIHLELGCGKGQFISKIAIDNADVNYIAIDLVDAMLGLAKRNIEQAYKSANKKIENVVITRFDIERILMILGNKDKIERIYINFCNPWPRGKHRKKRLTHSKQLEKYKEFLVSDGEIYFKTDDINLFNDSITYLEDSGFKILKQTNNLHSENDFWNNIETEHEKMFAEQGVLINALIAKLNKPIN